MLGLAIVVMRLLLMIQFIVSIFLLTTDETEKHGFFTDQYFICAHLCFFRTIRGECIVDNLQAYLY